MIIEEFWRLMLLIIGKYQYVVQCVRCNSPHEDYSHNCSQLEIRFIVNNAYVIIEKAHIPLLIVSHLICRLLILLEINPLFLFLTHPSIKYLWI